MCGWFSQILSQSVASPKNISHREKHLILFHDLLMCKCCRVAVKLSIFFEVFRLQLAVSYQQEVSESSTILKLVHVGDGWVRFQTARRVGNTILKVNSLTPSWAKPPAGARILPTPPSSTLGRVLKINRLNSCCAGHNRTSMVVQQQCNKTPEKYEITYFPKTL